MSYIPPLIFETETQLKIFFSLLNNPKGLTRTDLHKKLLIPRTTILNNLDKLKKRIILTGPELNIKLPYVNSYRKKLSNNERGRPYTIFYVPKIIRNNFINFQFPNVEIKGENIWQKKK